MHNVVTMYIVTIIVYKFQKCKKEVGIVIKSKETSSQLSS